MISPVWFIPVTASFLAALVLAIVLAAPSISLLGRLKARQIIRKEGPQSHYGKAGTPSMGGFYLLASALAAAAPFVRSGKVAAALACTALFVLLGFCDDFLSLRHKQNKGLSARQKLLGQILLGGGFALALWFGHHQTWVWLPIAHVPVRLGWWYWPALVFLMVGVTNAVNLTDGLDGLAATTVAIAMVGLAALVARLGAPLMQDGLLAFALAVSGACVGFLWANAHPASVFMGDTGSLGLGAALVTVAAVGHLEIYLLPIGIVFVAEALSVMIQVSYFKATKGKRIFRMSPLHHHFEQGGAAETKIVARFAIVGLLGALLAVSWL